MCEMKFYFLAALPALSGLLHAQSVVDVDKSAGVPPTAFFTVNGTPFINVKYVRVVDGSPYFGDRWMNALAIAGNGRRYRTSKAKLDLLDNSVHFLNHKDDEFVSSEPLQQITFTDTVANASYQFIHSSAVPALAGSKAGWYRQLVAGKVSLFQHIIKNIQESKPYNSAVAEQRIHTFEEYLVVYNGQVQKARKPKDLPPLLADGRAELEEFLKSGRANGSTAEQLTALVNHYNSLQ